MKTWLIALALVLQASCTTHSVPQANTQTVNKNINTSANTIFSSGRRNVDVAKEQTPKKNIPRAFRRVDFKNLSYPISWRNEIIRLKDGRREYYQHRNLGSGWFDLHDVSYVDITGDAKKEAIVTLNAVLCGASCDGGSHLFYFYAVRKSKLQLLWRFGTGSLGYGCGLKSFDLAKRRFTLEVFNSCVLKGSTIESRYEGGEHRGKFIAQLFTRFVLEFKHGKPVLRKRQVLPSPREDVMNYDATISIRP